MESVLVLGDGIVGLAAAIALRRALPNTSVTLVLLPVSDHSWIDRLGAAPPSLARFHRQIGLDASLFARRCKAAPVRLRRYLEGGRGPVREACTPTIPFVEGVPLHHVWLRSLLTSPASTPDFATLLLELREANSDEGGFGVRYDAPAYRALLIEMATALGVVMHHAQTCEVACTHGAVDRLLFDGETEFRADLYVDAAGPRSRLMEAIGGKWTSWTRWLPTMRCSVEPGRGVEAGEEVIEDRGDSVSWRTTAWIASITRSKDAPSPGRQAEFWRANVVAVGPAAAQAPATGGSVFGHALEDILRLLNMLGSPAAMVHEQREYQRRTEIAYDSLLAWSSLSMAPRNAERPDNLVPILEAFAARGRIASIELDPTLPGEWLARLMVRGPQPRRIDPTAWALPAATVEAIIARAEQAIRD